MRALVLYLSIITHAAVERLNKKSNDKQLREKDRVHVTKRIQRMADDLLLQRMIGGVRCVRPVPCYSSAEKSGQPFIARMKYS